MFLHSLESHHVPLFPGHKWLGNFLFAVSGKCVPMRHAVDLSSVSSSLKSFPLHEVFLEQSMNQSLCGEITEVLYSTLHSSQTQFVMLIEWEESFLYIFS
jgi:hypothetical protein